nr:MAG TPA: hypothetical protein [Bacteriophage sp.]DAW65925.1 MAG TPA: hypothetical protein [Bacteriophage sp.]
MIQGQNSIIITLESIQTHTPYKLSTNTRKEENHVIS